MSKYESYACQKCGEFIGWIGRFLFPFLHDCPKEPEAALQALADEGQAMGLYDIPQSGEKK